MNNSSTIQLVPREKTTLSVAKVWVNDFIYHWLRNSGCWFGFFNDGTIEWAIYPLWLPVWHDQNIESSTRCRAVGLTFLETKTNYLRGELSDDVVRKVALCRNAALRFLEAVTSVSDQPGAIHIYVQKRYDMLSPQLGTYEWVVQIDLKRPVLAGTWDKFVKSSFNDVNIRW